MAESIRQVWGKKSKTVSASSTGVVDRVALASFKRLEYIVNLRDATSDKSKGFKFSVDNVESGLNDQVYAKAGDPISIEISAKVNGSDCEIELKNNEIFDLGVKLIRSVI